MCSNFWTVHVCDRRIGVVSSFLHSRPGGLESGNPPQHVTTAMAQGHELLEAVQEHVGSALDEVPLEVGHTSDLVLQVLTVEESLVDDCFFFSPISQGWSLLSRL